MNLTGIHTLSNNNLFGTTVLETPMKKKLVDKLLIPCVQRNWEELHYNYLLWNTRLRDSFEGPENEIYLYFLQSLELMMNNYKKDESTNMQLVYNLPHIKLKPEYEIHKLLYGTKFDKHKLDRIAILMKRDGITIEQIKRLTDCETRKFQQFLK
jgi:hypothetical protein